MISVFLMQVLLFIWGSISLGLSAALLEEITNSKAIPLAFAVSGCIIMGLSIVMLGL